MDRQNVVLHTMEYHSAIKNNEVLIRATIQMKFKHILQCERSQTLKAPRCMIPFIWVIRVGTYPQRQNRLITARGWEEGVIEGNY